MLEVIFYKSNEDLVAMSATKNQPLIICPSPIVADGLRRLFSKGLEIITISKWAGDSLKNKNLKKSNKSELMLRLSSIWRHYFPDEEAHLFFKAFEIFTDLRSYSLNLELLSEFFKELDPKTTKSILIFWTLLENEKIIDEQKSYEILSTFVSDRPLWVMGFKHLSGIQIDMLKIISESTTVNIFFPKSVYAESLSTDWIRWILPEEKSENDKPECALKIIQFPKNKLNFTLAAFKEIVPIYNLVPVSASSSFSTKQEVSSVDHFFKSPEDIFAASRNKLIENLKTKIKDKIEIEHFLKMMSELSTKALSDEDFLLYKTISLLEEALIVYAEFQSFLDHFTLKVLLMILELNSPRVSMATIIKDPTTRILELNELPYDDSNYPQVLVGSSSYGPLKSTDSKYSEKMTEALKVIAPIKRAGLDFLFLKNEILLTLSNKNNFLLLEEGLELVDLSWREILKNFDVAFVNLETEFKLKKQKDYLNNSINKIPHIPKNYSASRLQTFVDCPRKYYFSYIDKIEHRPEERMQIAPDEMGQIEHKIIQKYFDENGPKSEFKSAVHEKLCNDVLGVFVNEKKLQLSSKEILTSLFELIHFTQNGIEYLLNFGIENDIQRIAIETKLEFNPWNIVGSIDCIVYLANNQVALFDFKRSSMSIGPKKETLSLEKIQIWVYLLYTIKHLKLSIHSWGYLNLSDISASQIYDETKSQTLTESLLDDFEIKLKSMVKDLNAEEIFRARPRQDKTCNFCEVELFCNKGNEEKC